MTMARILLFVVVLFILLFALRLLRIFIERRLRDRQPPVEGEMVRDPVCGTWVDRRIALAGRRGQEWVPVCSEKCRRSLESA